MNVTASGHRLKLWEDTAYTPSRWEVQEEVGNDWRRFSGPFKSKAEAEAEVRRLVPAKTKKSSGQGFAGAWWGGG